MWQTANKVGRTIVTGVVSVGDMAGLGVDSGLEFGTGVDVSTAVGSGSGVAVSRGLGSGIAAATGKLSPLKPPDANTAPTAAIMPTTTTPINIGSLEPPPDRADRWPHCGQTNSPSPVMSLEEPKVPQFRH